MNQKAFPGFRLLSETGFLLLLLYSLTAHHVTAGPQAVEAWVQKYSHAVDVEDVAAKVVADQQGNFIVVGYSDGIAGREAIIIKYDAAGNALWTNRYSGPGGGETPTAAAVDSSGNIFVTGRSYSGSSYDDLATVAYSAAGVALWTNRYNTSPFRDHTVPHALAVDNSGNVFVTGRSGYYYDFATIKYSNAGVPVWTNTYTSAGNNYDEALALAVDGDGNVIVTGSSLNDYVTIKYNAAGGALWTNRYNGTGNGTDVPSAIAVDNSGNVFVTGESFGAGNTSYDFATVKYSAAGVPLWTNRYVGTTTPVNSLDYARAIAVDAGGNVYVAGRSAGSQTNTDYAVIKYSNAGSPLWTNRYAGPGGLQDYCEGLVVASSGMVAVTGYSWTGSSGLTANYATVAYSSAGIPLWTNLYDGPAGLGDHAVSIAANPAGDICITGYSRNALNHDFATLAYSSAGTVLWTNRYTSTKPSIGWPAGIAVDKTNGSVYVTGWSYGTAEPGSDDYATIAYDSSGLPLWTNRYNLGDNFRDRPEAIAIGNNGLVYVTGESFYDFATIAYASTGVALWTNRYDGPGGGSSSDRAKALATDPNGNIFVTGSSYLFSSPTRTDFATIAYSQSGMALWTNLFGGAYDESPAAIAVSPNGNIHVVGSSANTNTYPYDNDMVIVAYSNAGDLLWTNRFRGAGQNDDYATCVAVDATGNVYVGAYTRTNAAPFTSDFLTFAYTDTGLPLWTNRYNATGNSQDQLEAIAVGPSGNIFVGGTAAGDLTVIAYASNGAALWTNRYNGPANGYDKLWDLVVDGFGNIIVTGHCDSGGALNFATVAYSNAGLPLWTNRYEFGAEAYAVAVDGGGDVFVTGVEIRPDNAHVFATVKYITAYPPEISSQPTNQAAPALADVAFSVGATGKPAPGYQWFFNAAPLSGETNSTLQLFSVTTNDAGIYAVVVSNSAGEVTSSNATLTVILPAPSSQVAALPAEAGPAIAVSWSGQAGPGGLPPVNYTIMVSTNGIDFSVWLANTTATNADYHGVPGGTYHFYSLAQDALGQTEAAPVTADAQTTVPLDAPVLASVPDFIIDPGQQLSFTNATLAGTPGGEFEFFLDSPAPAGATVTATNGVFKWTPTCSQATTTNVITVRVRDTAAPQLTDTVSFIVTVRECVSPQLGRLVLEAGTSGRVPVLLVSSVPLTNLTMQLTLPPERLINPFLEIIVPEICASSVVPLDSNVYQLDFTACPGQFLVGTQQVAWLYVTAATDQSSGFMQLLLDAVAGQQPDGTPVANFAPQSGNVVVVANEPLLAAAAAPAGGIAITLYGHVGQTNVVQTSTQLAPPPLWQDWQTVIFTNLFWEGTWPEAGMTNATLFFRAYRPPE